MSTKIKKRPSAPTPLAAQIARLATESAIATAPIRELENAPALTRLEASEARKASAKHQSNARRKVKTRTAAAKRRSHRRP